MDISVVIFTRSDFYPEVNWSVGMILLWSLLMTLWFRWFDDGSGCRPLFTSLGKAVRAQHGIIVSQDVGESERTHLENDAGIGTCCFELDRNMKGAPLFSDRIRKRRIRPLKQRDV